MLGYRSGPTATAATQSSLNGVPLEVFSPSAADRYAIEGRKSLPDHIADYIAHCRHVGHAARHVDQKERHLERLLGGTGSTRLSDLTADALERHLRGLRDAELSARSVNFARQIAVAFLSCGALCGCRVDRDSSGSPIEASSLA